MIHDSSFSIFIFLTISSFQMICSNNTTHISIDEIIKPVNQCLSSIHLFSWFLIFLSTLFWIFRVVRFFYHAVQYYDIKKFYNSALKIDDVSIYSRFSFSFHLLSCAFVFCHRLNWTIIHGMKFNGAFAKCKKSNKCAFIKKISPNLTFIIEF